MQRDVSENADFTAGKPWLNASPNHLSLNVEEQQSRQASVLNYYKNCPHCESNRITKKYSLLTQQILDSYPILTSLEKNQLWKLIMKKATVYRSKDDVLTVHIYPNLPK